METECGKAARPPAGTAWASGGVGGSRLWSLKSYFQHTHLLESASLLCCFDASFDGQQHQTPARQLGRAATGVLRSRRCSVQPHHALPRVDSRPRSVASAFCTVHYCCEVRKLKAWTRVTRCSRCFGTCVCAEPSMTIRERRVGGLFQLCTPGR